MAVLLALAAAAAYGLADFVGGVTSKRTSPWAVALVAQLGGSAVVFVLSLFVDGTVTAADVWWSVVAGVANGFGTAFLYRGLSSGRMGVVAPVSGVGAVLVPVAVGLATGERPSALVWVGIVAAIPGIWLVSREPTSAPVGGAAGSGVVDGILAGVGFGTLFAALAQIPEEAGFLPLALNQLIAAGAIVLVAVVLRQPWVPRDPRTAYGVISGVLGATATGAFMVATQSGYLTVTAVLASLYPAFTVVLAATVLREHVHRSQGLGLALCATAVGLVAGGNSPAAAEETVSEPRPAASASPTPSSGPSPPPSAEPEPLGRVTLTVVGDIMLDRGVAAASPPDDPVWALRPIRELLSRSDLTVGNLEMALSEDGTPQQVPVGDSFAARPEVLEGLADLGLDALSLANNHTGDYGERALLQTVDAVRRSEIAGFGAGRDLDAASRPAVLEVDGMRLGFVGFNSIGETPQATPDSPGALSIRMPIRTGPLNRDDLRHVEGVVRRLAERVDAVVVLPHWGDQYVHDQLPVQSYVGRRLVAAGADLVVGGHPHVVQGVERVRDAVVAHSLGNLVFDMDFDDEAMEGVALTATFVGGELTKVQLTPYRMDASFRPHLVEGADILADVTANSRGRWSTPAR